MADLAVPEASGLTEAQQTAILRHLNLDPNNVNTQALLLICQRYGLDPLLKHVVLISGRPYVTRDGYLAVAHRTGQLDGIEIVEDGEDDSHWWAKVSVYRKDMGRPFTYTGRFPKADAKHMAKYGPEMAIKCGEVMALRRAFNVTGIGAADEQWESHAEPPPPAIDWDSLGWADQAEYDEAFGAARTMARALPEDQQQTVRQWLEAEGWVLPYSKEQVLEWTCYLSELASDPATEHELELNVGSDPQNSGDDAPRPTTDTADPTLLDQEET